MKNKRFIFITIALIWTAVIFSFSLQTGEVSGDLSGSVLEPILGFFMPSVLESPEQFYGSTTKRFSLGDYVQMNNTIL